MNLLRKKMKEFRNLTITAQCMRISTCSFCTILYSLDLRIYELTLYKVLFKNICELGIK